MAPAPPGRRTPAPGSVPSHAQGLQRLVRKQKHGRLVSENTSSPHSLPGVNREPEGFGNSCLECARFNCLHSPLLMHSHGKTRACSRSPSDAGTVIELSLAAISLPAARLPGDKPCPSLEPPLRSSLHCHRCQPRFGTAVPLQLSLRGDLLATAGLCAASYPSTDHLLLRDTAATFQAPTAFLGVCRSQVGCGAGAVTTAPALAAHPCAAGAAPPRVPHPAKGHGWARVGTAGAEGFSLLTRCET